MAYRLTSSHKVFLLELNSPAWNLCSYCLLRDSVSFEQLEVALNQVVRKNDALRMKIISETEVNFTEYAPHRFERLDFADEVSFLSWAHERANESVAALPGMWKAFLIRINGRTGVFNIGHHIICDALNVVNLYQKIVDEIRTPSEQRDSYSAFLEANELYLQSRQHERDRIYWESILADPAPLVFSGRPIGECENLTVTLPPIKSFCSELGLSEATVIYAATGLLLMRLQGLDSLSLGIPILGRTTKQEMQSLGLYMHDVPMHLYGGEKSFLEFAREVESRLYDLFRHQRYDLPAVPLFDVSVDYSEYPESHDYDASVLYNDYVSTAMEFHFLQGEQLELTIRSQKGLLKDLSAAANAMIKLLQSVMFDPQQSIWTLPIAGLPDSGRNADIPELGIYALFEQQNTGKIIDGGREYSLAELRHDAEKIDAAIHGEKRIIGILCDRSYEELAAIFGVVRGGNAYLPLSPDDPADRIHLLLEQSSCSTVLTQRKYLDRVSNPIVIEEILNRATPTVIPPVEALPDDPLYVIFTSGSTGTPKGALVSNRAAVNRVLWMCHSFFTPETVVMRKTPYTFDVSVWEIFGFALGGFSLYILPPEDHFKQNKVLEHIHKGNVTDLHFVPTVFDVFLDAMEKAGGNLPSLKNIFLSGEALNAALIHRAPAKVHNLYGPTECAVDVTAYDCQEQEVDPVPIGKPIDNCTMYVLDQRLQPLPVGLIGQICIGGTPVGLGYVNDPVKTAEVFVPNPFGPGKLYLTGDLGYWREDGQLVFVGRSDDQIKLHGQRIELGEIEASMKKLVPSAAVINDRSRLIAFYTGAIQTDLREQLMRILPRHMVPSSFVHIDEMPLLPNGKTDRKALAAFNHVDRNYEPPIGETETLICSLFSQILDVSNVGRHDNFYDLGGTSLSVMELMSEEPLTSLSPSVFMSDPTPAGVAANISQMEKSDCSVAPLYLPEQASFALVLFPYAGGDAASYSALVSEVRKRKANVSLFFVPWGCNYDEVSRRLSSLSLPLHFYSHCAGAVIAMKLLKRMSCVERYTIGANLPPSELDNIWISMTDKEILGILHMAGMPQLPHEFEVLRQFRANTDEYFQYFQHAVTPSIRSVDLVLGKSDIFTELYHQFAKELWERYVSDVSGIHFLDTSSHYFQTSLASQLADILLED